MVSAESAPSPHRIWAEKPGLCCCDLTKVDKVPFVGRPYTWRIVLVQTSPLETWLLCFLSRAMLEKKDKVNSRILRDIFVIYPEFLQPRFTSRSSR